MAVLTVGKVRVVSLSITALERDISKGHILIERLPMPEHFSLLGQTTKPAADGFFCRTACGVKIIARIGPTLVHSHGKPTNRYQLRTDCLRCSGRYLGGELTITRLPLDAVKCWEPRQELELHTADPSSPTMLDVLRAIHKDRTLLS